MFVDGKLARISRGGVHANSEGMLEDYAFVVQGLLALYQEDFDYKWYEGALALQEAQENLFSGLGKRYSLSPVHNSPLPPRQDYVDTDLPSAQATCISNFLTLNAMEQANSKTADKMLKEAEKLLLAVGDGAVKAPLSHASYLNALDQYMDSQTVVLVTPGDVKSNAGAELGTLGTHYFPQVVFVSCDIANRDHAAPVASDKELLQGAASLYILGSEGNVEFSNPIAEHISDACSALNNPSEICFE